MREAVLENFLQARGWRFTPTPGRRLQDLPRGRLIVLMGDHVAAAINGVIHDDRDGLRDSVDGYWTRPSR